MRPKVLLSKHARRGRNPKTGEQMILDARRVVTWSYSPRLKAAVNGAGKSPSKTTRG
ncbi:MAG: HU family DNA-binding protein [Desulfomonile tiedjei]|uniref:HU family DNA-binding protein n=1 Tax=Desulfomonile tiedjei TaxID=2358 RepID=A0A9D6Z505_9BACT|nr:HU family DNA-binding protein [Desulfomonile tiedjei]